MASTTESGHSKNVALFDELISFVAAYGAAYNPSKNALKFDALQALSVSAKNANSVIGESLSVHSNAVTARETAFSPLSKLATRVLNAIKATDTTENVDDHAKSLVRKIQGTRATAKKTEEEKAAMMASGKEVKEISTSQMSHDSRVDNFDKLIKLLASIPLYAPNENELKVESLTALLNDLKAKNAAVVQANVQLSNARIARNDVLYKENTGLYDVAFDVKTYVKSLFGASSSQFKQISGLKFTKR